MEGMTETEGIDGAFERETQFERWVERGEDRSLLYTMMMMVGGLISVSSRFFRVQAHMTSLWRRNRNGIRGMYLFLFARQCRLPYLACNAWSA